MPQPAEIDVQAPIETLVKVSTRLPLGERCSAAHAAALTSSACNKFVDARSLHRNQQDGTEDPKDELVVVQYAAGKMEPVCGKSPRHSLLISTGQGTKNPFFHGCCVYVHEKEELYVTSNLLQTSIASRLPLIIISQIKLKRSGDSERGPLRSLIFSKLRPPASMPMPAGACRFRDGVVYCAQGTPTPGSGGVYYMPMGHPPEQLVSSYYGTDFNSVQDVAAGSDGVLWFTDSDLGYQNDFRPPPQLPNRIYRYDATHGDLRAVAGDIANPSGLTVSKDQTRLYVSDYSARHSTGDLEPAR